MKGKRKASRNNCGWLMALEFVFPHNMEKRTHYGCVWHERNLIDRIKDKFTRVTSPSRKHRLVQRMQAAQVRLLALKLGEK